MKLKIPDPPYIVAGACGGPVVEYLVTPLRNALTLASGDTSASATGLLRQVVRNGPFCGGLPMAQAGVPGFLVLGPAFHMYKDMTGGSNVAAVGLTALSESVIFYGAETNNAQVAFNLKALKNNKSIPIIKRQSPLNPVGGGFGLYMARNVLAMSGLRVFSSPCQRLITNLQPALPPTTVVLMGDLIANILVSAASAPLHQLYGWSVTSRCATTTPKQPFLPAAWHYLKAQYLTPRGTLSFVAGRDMSLRIAYNATIFTVYGCIERTVVDLWPVSWQWQQQL